MLITSLGGVVLFVGVDIGGTTIKFAFVNENGDIHLKWQEKTKQNYTDNSLAEQITTSIEHHRKRAQIKKEQILSVGVGAPGPVDSKNGILLSATNINLSPHYRLQKELSDYMALPVILENDANCAVLGERWIGSGIGYKDIVLLTIGTGIGGGIISNGQLMRGNGGSAGEIGHIKAVSSYGVRCNCGKWGCLETIASATGIVRVAKEIIDSNKNTLLVDHLSVQNIFHFAGKNDIVAKEVVQRTMKPLGIALANVAAILNPEVIIIGGGVSQAGKLLLEPLQSYYDENLFPEMRGSTLLKLATLGNDAGVVGAAWSAKQLIIG